LAYEVGLSVVPTGLVGGPWQQNTDGSTLQVLITQPWLMWIWAVLIAVVVIAWRRNRSMTLLSLVTLLAGVAVLIGLVGRARLDFLGPAIGRDTRYVLDIVPVAALCLALLIAGGRATATPRLGATWREVALRAAPVFALAYALVCWPTVYFVAESRHSLGVENWVDAAQDAVQEFPDRVFVDGFVPDRVVSSSFADSARLGSVLTPFGVPTSRFNQPATEWWRVDSEGDAEPAVFIQTQEILASTDSCGDVVDGAGAVITFPAVAGSVGSGVLTARIGWSPRSDITSVIEVGDRRWEVDIAEGAGYLFVPLEPGDRDIAIGGFGAGERACITSVEIGETG
jgi:hypothetical protein